MFFSLLDSSRLSEANKLLDERARKALRARENAHKHVEKREQVRRLESEARRAVGEYGRWGKSTVMEYWFSLCWDSLVGSFVHWWCVLPSTTIDEEIQYRWGMGGGYWLMEHKIIIYKTFHDLVFCFWQKDKYVSFEGNEPLRVASARGGSVADFENSMNASNYGEGYGIFSLLID